MQYRLLNTGMHGLHLFIISSSIFGFLITPILGYYLIFQGLILCSWLGYGLYDGRWGRCIITEMQWAIKEKLQSRPKTESYIQYWVQYKLGMKTPEKTVDKYTTAIYGITFALGIARFFHFIP